MSELSAFAGSERYGACPDAVAGMAGLEPANAGVKVPCLTTWLHPNVVVGQGPERTPRPSATSMGWVMGLEPTTPGTTIRCSAS